MAQVFARARDECVTVLLDGNGMDETWAGYDYYQRAEGVPLGRGVVQGSRSPSSLEGCLEPEFAQLARAPIADRPFADALTNLQYRDLSSSKIPRSTRFADRVSMMFSRELRLPFLDHRLVELGLRQPENRRLRDGVGKWLPRRVASQLVPSSIRTAPKRAVQTPQREWLRGPLIEWAQDYLEETLTGFGGVWLVEEEVRRHWREYLDGAVDNSFPVWQWISLALSSSEERAEGEE